MSNDKRFLVTGDQVKAAALAANIQTVNHHKCAVCGCMVRYVINEGDLFFDPTCSCSLWSTGYEPRGWESAADWINMQSEDTWRVEIAGRFGLDLTAVSQEVS